MHQDTYNCLVEALRRFECFSVRDKEKHWTMKDLMEAWTGLGREAGDGYRQAVANEVMARVHKSNFPHVEWWRLTAKGAIIVLQWHKDGYTCRDEYELETKPPHCWPDKWPGVSWKT